MIFYCLGTWVKLLFNPSQVDQLYSAEYSYQIREVVLASELDDYLTKA